MKNLFIVLIILITFRSPAQNPGCTAFSVNTKMGTVLCKNFDWEIPDGYLIFNPSKGKREYSDLHSDSSKWISKYSNITLNHFGYGFPLGGINEKGLAIEELSTISVSQLEISGKPLNEFSFIQYLLDNCKNINEVRSAAKNVFLETMLFPIHYIAADREGNSAVIELSQIGLKIFESQNNFQVISNNLLDESKKYLKRFTGFGGELEITNSAGSNDRYVTVSNLLHKSEIIDLNVLDCFAFLDSVKQHDTQWQIVYDCSTLAVNFQIRDFDIIRQFKIDEINQLKKVSYINLFDPEGSLKVLSKEENESLLDEVIFKYKKILNVKNSMMNVLGRIKEVSSKMIEKN